MEFKNLRVALEHINDILTAETLSAMPDDWELKKKIDFDVVIDGVFYNIEFSAPEYWKWAENGRRPGKMPPISVIKEWISRKQILPKSNNGKIPSENSLAFLIARKIGRDGTEGKHFLETGLNYVESQIDDIITDAIAKDINAEIDKFILGV